VADYSEFPTTPTGWQERQAADWETGTPLETEDPEQPRRPVDLVALVPGLAFVVLAIVLMIGVHVPVGVFHNGGILWVVLIGAGIALLIRELRRPRSKR
jgi:hypothetical protein